MPMDRELVITLVSAGVLVTFLIMTVVLLGALPPWPIWLFFAVSHGFFCVIVWRTKPYRGPFVRPMANITSPNSSSLYETRI